MNGPKGGVKGLEVRILIGAAAELVGDSRPAGPGRAPAAQNRRQLF